MKFQSNNTVSEKRPYMQRFNRQRRRQRQTPKPTPNPGWQHSYAP